MTFVCNNRGTVAAGKRVSESRVSWKDASDWKPAHPVSFPSAVVPPPTSSNHPSDFHVVHLSARWWDDPRPEVTLTTDPSAEAETFLQRVEKPQSQTAGLKHLPTITAPAAGRWIAVFLWHNSVSLSPGAIFSSIFHHGNHFWPVSYQRVHGSNLQSTGAALKRNQLPNLQLTPSTRGESACGNHNRLVFVTAAPLLGFHYFSPF